MIVSFYLHYKVEVGNYLGIQYLSDKGEDEIIMQSPDGENWIGILELSVLKSIQYKYFLASERGVILQEFGNFRRLIIPTGRRRLFVIDNWRVRNAESHVFYKNAFSKAIFSRKNKILNKTKDKVTPIEKTNTVVFTISVPDAPYGRKIGICGSSPSLGEWKSALLMQEILPSMYVIEIPVDTLSVSWEYKYVIMGEEDGSIYQWESGDNRVFNFTFPDFKNNSAIRHDEIIRFDGERWRGAGVAMPVFSLRTHKSFGIGEFTDLNVLTDWVAKIGMNLIQVLPVNDTIATKTWVDSYPYAAISVFALHPLYINIEQISKFKRATDQKAYEEDRKKLNELTEIDFESVLEKKFYYFRILWEQLKESFKSDSSFQEFFHANKEWLLSYASFCYLRDKNGTPDFNQWERYKVFDRAEIEVLYGSDAEAANEMNFYMFLQYHADRQLKGARDYARSNGIALKGDLPIGIYRHSADAWVEPQLFNMDEQAGAPPDDYSVLGQNWGFPTYNWEEMAKDNFSWWRRRMQKLEEYFDALRIDHILGFFRIWAIPLNQIYGTMGLFNPRKPFSREELARSGFRGNLDRYTKPFITEEMLAHDFGEDAETVKQIFFNYNAHGRFQFKDQFPDQRSLLKYIEENQYENWKDKLLMLMTEIIFIEEEGVRDSVFNPRITVSATRSFEEMGDYEKSMVHYLYNDYYFNRHNDFWKEQAYWKLPALIDASNMLICGEDLGMIPRSVPEVMKNLNILSLEIQRMPKSGGRFGHVPSYPYFSVCSPSCHDMSTIRGWWESDYEMAKDFYYHYLRAAGEAPRECTPEIVQAVIEDHLASPSMLAIFPIQDLLGMDAVKRRKIATEEQINDPSNPRHYWRYRFHFPIEELVAYGKFNKKIRELVAKHRRG